MSTASSDESRPNVDLRGERPMDRTLVGDLEQPDALLLRKLAGDRDLALDPIEHALCGFTFCAVVGVDPRMAQANRHAADWPPFPSRIQRDRHRRSGAEGCQQQIVRPEPPVGPSGGHRLVGDQARTPRGDLLGESVSPAMHEHDGLLVWIDHADLRLREGLDRGEWPGAESNCRHADFQSAALPTELPGRVMQQKNLAGCMMGWEWRRAMAWASFSRTEDHDPAPTVCVTPLGGSARRGCARR